MTYQSIILADSPLGYWRVGESAGTTAADLGSGSHTGTYIGAPTLGATGIAGGAGNTAMMLTGNVNDYMEATTYTTIPTPPLSIECWVKFAGAFNDTSLGGWYSASGVLAFQLYLLSGTNVRIGTEQGNANANCTGLLDGNYHHLVGTCDGTNGNVRLYYDGALVAGPTAVTFNGGASAHPFQIGRYNDGTTSVNGTLDEWAVYPAALSLGQVQTHYAAGLVGGPAWVSPADTAAMNITPVLVLTSQVSASAQHFELQLDTVNTFDSGNLRDLSTQTNQTGWEYFDGVAWQAFPNSGLPAAKSGNDVRYTVQPALSMTTWYRRVRAGV